MVEYWEKYYARSLARKGKLSQEDCYCSPRQLSEFLLKHDLPLEGDVLVVGSGTSELPAILAKRATVTALDVSETAASWMRQAQPQIHWHQGDAAAMPHSWMEGFDCLIDKGLLAHKFADDLLACSTIQSALLSEYCRVLKPGGFAVVVSLGQLNLKESDLSSWAKLEKHCLGETLVYVFQRWSEAGLAGLLASQTSSWHSWVLGISQTSSSVLVRMASAQRANVDLQVSDTRARIVYKGDYGEQCLELPLPSRPIQARWTKQGLELTLASSQQS